MNALLWPYNHQSPARKAAFYKYHRYLRRTGACLRPCHSSALLSGAGPCHKRLSLGRTAPRYLGLATYIAGLVGSISGLMETQEFTRPGTSFVGPQSYSPAALLLAAKAFLSMLLGLAVTYAWVVLPQVGKAPLEEARKCGSNA